MNSIAYEIVPDGGREAGCIFCEIVARRTREVISENSAFIVVFDNYPVNQGHALIIPKRHIATPFHLSAAEGGSFTDILRALKLRLDDAFHPDGYNLGINAGQAAGQTVPHLHIHVIPRYVGDVDNPRGGIRNFKKALVAY